MICPKSRSWEVVESESETRMSGFRVLAGNHHAWHFALKCEV